MRNRYHIIIVGGGIGGMTAANLLSRHGLRILVVDENSHIGGQLLRKPAHAEYTAKRFEPDRFKRRGMQLVDRLIENKIDILNGAQVLGIYPDHTILVEENQSRITEYRADALILATGARERYLPFKGWDLPGVISTGAAQILMKSSGILPGRKTLIAGCGPLMYGVAADIIGNGGRVEAVLDQNGMAEKLNAFTAGPSILPKLFEGVAYLTRLAAARVPLKQRLRVIEAKGSNHLERVVAGRIDATGSVIQGSERIYTTDTLAVGYGFSPNIELPQQAGCALSHAIDNGGWYVEVGTKMETSLDAVYAVGETTGIGGAGKSFVEGQIAAWDLLFKLGRVNRKTHTTHTLPLLRERKRKLQYSRFLNRLSRLHPGCYAGISDDTVICRCEEITMGEIRRQLDNGFNTMNSIKKATRSSMGNCQGRICGPILSDMISALAQQPTEAVGTTSARAPIKLVSLGALAQMKTNHQDNDGRQGVG
jgi:NADPH-dependent 2,4-dienoyl-CoA reductase/sulfur reductase-like enzyme